MIHPLGRFAILASLRVPLGHTSLVTNTVGIPTFVDPMRQAGTWSSIGAFAMPSSGKTKSSSPMDSGRSSSTPASAISNPISPSSSTGGFSNRRARQTARGRPAGQSFWTVLTAKPRDCVHHVSNCDRDTLRTNGARRPSSPITVFVSVFDKAHVSHHPRRPNPRCKQGFRKEARMFYPWAR